MVNFDMVGRLRNDRLIVYGAGQACGYEMGHQAINRERDKAKAALGSRFDLRAFNDAVVLGGNVPMDVLAKNVDDYIATAKA
jgi:uncharacterized protein (DUF885 family)